MQCRHKRISTLPCRVHLLPQPANSIQGLKFIVFVKNIVPYPTLQPNEHLRNYFSDKRFVRHFILFDLRYSGKSQVLYFVQFAITIKQFATDLSMRVKTYSFGSTSVFANGLEDKFYVAQVLYLMMFRLKIKSILDTLLNCYRSVPDIRTFQTVSNSSYEIIINLRIPQKVKTRAYLEPKVKFRSQSQTQRCRVNLSDLHQVRQVSRS